MGQRPAPDDTRPAARVLGRPARPLVIAHRGASGDRPENTLPAFALAVAQAADMIETDLHRSRDGAVVIRHDAELASLGGQRDIAETDLAEIRSLDAGGGEVIPTLDEVLDGFGRAIPFNLEIKRGEGGVAGEYEGIEGLALEAVRAREILEDTLFSSFYDGVLERLRAAEPKARLAVLVSPRQPEHVLERAAAVGAEAVNPWHGLATEAFVEAAHGRGLAVFPYTVDEPDEIRELLARGVDGIFTNHPAWMRALLDRDR